MPSLIVCHACDLAHSLEAPPEGKVRIRCVRCQAELYRTNGRSLENVVALAVCGLVLFILANLYPLVSLTVNGATRATTLIGAARALYGQGYVSVASLVLFTAILVPLAQLLTFLYVLAPLQRGRRAPGDRALFRALVALRPWGMVEVFMLGAVVALVKLSATAEVTPRVALIAYGLLMLAIAALTSATPTEQFWRWVMERRE